MKRCLNRMGMLFFFFFILVNIGRAEKKSYFCSFAAVPPTIDGILDEWGNVPAIFLPTTDEERVKVNWSGPSDLSGYFKMMWDDKNLYLGVEVIDNIFKQTHDDLSLSGIWSEDSIQVGFDMGADAKTSGYDYNDYEYGFALTKGGPRAYRWYSSNLVSGRCDNLLEMSVKRDEELKKIIYEIAIPWKELQFSPQASKEFGFTIVIQDSDDGDYGHIQWTPGITSSKDPTAFGRVYLVKDIPVESNKIKLSLSCKDSYTEKEAEIGLIINSSDELKNCKINVDILKDEQINLSQIKDIDIKKGIQQVFLKLPIEGFSMGEYNLKVSLIDSQNILLGKSVAKFKKISIDGIRQKLIEFSNVEYPKLSQEINKLENSGKDVTYQKISLNTLVLFTKFINSNLDEKDWIPLACEEIVGYEKILNRVKEEVDRIKKGEKVSFPSSIVYDASKPVIIKNSEFYQGNNPIMFIGVVDPNDMGGISVLPDYGFNSITFSWNCGPWALLETPEGYKNEKWPWPTQSAVDGVKSYCKTCQEKNIGAFPFLSPHYMPQWIWEKYPEYKSPGGGLRCWYGSLDMYNPYTKELYEAAFKRLIPELKEYPSLITYFFGGETGPGLCLSEYDLAAFRNYLIKKHKNITNLNSAWGTNYTSFEEIKFPKDIKENNAMWFDLCRFNQDSYTDFLKWVKDTIHKFDPDIPVSFSYLSTYAHDDPSDFENGSNIEDIFRVADISMVDAEVIYGSYRNLGAKCFSRYTMWYDLCKSMNPENILIDPEWHLVNPLYYHPPEYMRAVMWQGFLHGLSVGLIWKGYGYRGGGDSYFLREPELVEVAGRTSVDIRRLANYVEAFHKAERESVILYSINSFPRPGYLEEMISCYEGSFFLDRLIGFISERQVREGGLKEKKLLILPCVTHIEDATFEKIKEFVRNGGIVFMTENSLKYDEYGRERKERIEGERVFKVKGPLSPEKYSEALSPILEKANISRLVKVTGEKGSKVYGIEARSVKLKDGSILTYLINLSKEKQKVVLNIGFSIEKIEDLILEKEVTENFFELNPFEIRLLNIHCSTRR